MLRQKVEGHLCNFMKPTYLYWVMKPKYLYWVISACEKGKAFRCTFPAFTLIQLK